MNQALYVICRHAVGIMDGWRPISSTDVAHALGITPGQARYQIRKLVNDNLVKSCHDGGMDEDGRVFCYFGYAPTLRACETDEYKDAWNEERELCRDVWELDIGPCPGAAGRILCSQCGGGE